VRAKSSQERSSGGPAISVGDVIYSAIKIARKIEVPLSEFKISPKEEDGTAERTTSYSKFVVSET
jgi:hypothetical protein